MSALPPGDTQQDRDNPTAEWLFAAVGLSKQFGGVVALNEVSLGVTAGEVLAVIGENGAGKSTLMKILAGVIVPDTGSLAWQGDPITFRSTAEAIARGVSLIHQELNLVDNLSVAENLFLGREPQRFGWVRRQELADASVSYLERVGLSVDPRTSLSWLSVAEKQLVEIAKAVSTGARVLIMDEPTSSLSNRETERLFELVDSLRTDGTAVLYISHRLAEVDRLADRVEVLRDGRNAGSLRRSQIDHDSMVRAMIGRDPQPRMPSEGRCLGPTRLVVDSLRVPETSADISLEVRAGEIVVLAGLVGAGRSELLETIFGLRRAPRGTVRVDGQPVPPGRVRASIAAGLALVSEDRKLTGLHLDTSVASNLTLVSLGKSPAAPWIDLRWEARRAQKQVEALAIKTASLEIRVGSLSGGNQQKIAIAKWLIDPPGVLLLDEPTRGVDVGARHEIYQTLRHLAEDGVAILVVSSDMEEVIGIASRVLVMHDHLLTGELTGDTITESGIMELAVGGRPPLVNTSSVAATD
ncbi:MAG: sugar ABC transporter ATP-binding protein [Planctomycetaceae bacterium]|nr:MAG: sugar ABC transporter ATP-binding protein [Planctomycetaceae bacterium]